MAKVLIEHGWLEGEVLKNVLNDEEYYSFKGIPYAKPPVGELRWKAPQPLEPWTGVRNAKEHGTICHQFNRGLGQLMPGSDDCLFLNVYTKSLNKKAPVMFWIHGGGFEIGSGNSDFFGPDFLVNNDIVLVTINYRVGIMGFLSLQNEKIPGNAALKDQVAAMKWVKSNIAKFGGDPGNVTIFGESAGSVCVGLHLISPMSTGLFHKAIMQSGGITNGWSISFEPRRRAFEIGRQLGIVTTDENELYDFLMKQPYEKLVNIIAAITPAELLDLNWNLTHQPVIEKKFDGQEAFLTKSPFEYLRDGEFSNDVPLIIGHTSEDGVMMLQKIDDVIANLNRCPELLVPAHVIHNCSLREVFQFSDKIKKFFFKGKPISKDSLSDLIHFVTSIFFRFDNYRLLEYYKKSCESKVYHYSFSVKSDRNVGSTFMKITGITNVTTHADDLGYLFHFSIINMPIVKNTVSYNAVMSTCKLWTDFAKTGNPTPEGSSLGVTWTPYEVNSRHVLDIGNKLEAKTCNDDEEVKVLDEIYDFILKRI